MPRALLLLAGALCLLLPSIAAAAKRPNTNDLLQIRAPEVRGEAKAHPHVNVLVSFGTTEDGLPADPATFRARLGGADITREFQDVLEGSTVVGKRARIEKARLKLGRRRANRMRFSVYAVDAGARGRTPRDVDRVRFRAVDASNTPPAAKITEGLRSFQPGVPFTLDGSQTVDPDDDTFTLTWDFGDGTVVEGKTATHTYRDFADRTVRLIARDGGTNPDGSESEGVAVATLLATPLLPDGALPGTVQIGIQEGTLEFGVVPLGSAAQRTLVIRNTDTRESRHVVARLVSDVADFVVQPGIVDLGPEGRAEMTVTYAPTAVGHAHVFLTFAMAADNRQSLRVLAHGFGGGAGGTGPTHAAIPVYYTEAPANVFGVAVRAIRPDGTRVTVDSTVHACQATTGGFSSGDTCLLDADCAANGGTCQSTGICFGGIRDRQGCATVADCPNGTCSSAQLFDTVELCGDGAGGVFLLSDEGTFTDPTASDNELTATLLRIDVDADANTLGSTILDRVVSDTTRIACDGLVDGRAYLAEFRTDPDATTCSDKELLVGVNKRNGGTRTLLPRVDSATGIDCRIDDYDPVAHLEVSRDAREAFAAFESRGVWRLLPTPRQFVLPESFLGGVRPAVSPHEIFRIHPDGSLVLIATGGGKAGGLVNVYRLSDAQITGNPLPVSGLTPCASVQLPTNAIPDVTVPFTSVLGFAAGPSSPGSRDATLLVSATATSSKLGDVLQNGLNAVRATMSFSLPADSPSCALGSIVALEAFEQLTF